MTDKNIRRAATPDAAFYCSRENYEIAKEKVFAKTWHFIGTESSFSNRNYLYPFRLLENCLDEPVLLSVDANGNKKLISNVCTHRGFVLVEEPMQASMIRCRYHGRCFHPDGSFVSMPEFEEAENFPTRMDDLASAQLEEWHGFYFASLFADKSLHEMLKGIDERLAWFPFEKLKFKSELSHTYQIHANWALYCDNYLEGFHIPFVHKSLNKVIDYHNYETHLFDFCNLQIGIGRDDEMIFDLPVSSPDHGKKVAAYYYWIFPNMMMNFYPWGLSLNIVKPQAHDKTEISFLTFVSDEEKFNKGAGSDLNKVEMEDEEVVESVQKGLRSRLYFRGRYSPKMERGVHHFHLLMQDFMSKTIT